MAHEMVEEGTTSYLSVAFQDRNGVAATPLSVSYRIDCVTTGTSILGSTSLTPASTVEITITPSQNTLVYQSRRRERRRVSVTAVYGANDEISDQYDYWVKNLSAVT